MRTSSRRDFLKAAGLGAAAMVIPQSLNAQTPQTVKPNVLWITCEDICPNLGCYGDTYAQTPQLDRFAAKGLTYLNCWSNAPVCAPARTAIITGMYPPSLGAEHMRSLTRLPVPMKMYPQFLREAGYYCTNNNKEDYNVEKPGDVWDESSGKAHWRNRRPGQPFFAVFNLGVTHESQIRKRPHTLVHDPAKVRLPAYYPDAPEVRHDWAQYYDNITTMDTQFGQKVKELDDAGLAEETIVFFYGDNGCGMPRGKRFPYDSGLHVPLIVFVPEKFRRLAPKEYAPGGKTPRLVSFIDLAPTLLSLVGVKPPVTMHGGALMGDLGASPHEYICGFRGRMDARYDMIRSVRDQRYVYIRNYTPHLIYGQYVAYMFQTPTTQVWKRLFDEGKLTPQQARFWQTKPPEELYDLQNDPDEVNNLADSPAHQEALQRLRKAQQDCALETRDIGFLPEAEMHRRTQNSTPYEVAHDDRQYPLQRIMAMAETASFMKTEALEEIKKGFQDSDSGVRFWAALGILMRGKSGAQSARNELLKALDDESPSVRIVAAQALAQDGDDADMQKALPVLSDLAHHDKHGVYVALEALNAIDALGPKAASAVADVKALARNTAKQDARAAPGIRNLVDHILGNLQ